MRVFPFFLPVFFYGCDRQRDRLRHGSFTQKLWRVILPFHFDFLFFSHLRITTGLKMFCKYFDPLLLVGMEEEEDVVIVMTRPCICM